MAVYIIDPAFGSDTLGSGTERAPFATVAKAISMDECSGEDTIVLNHGTYTELVTIPNGRRIRFYGRGNVIFDGENAHSSIDAEDSTATPAKSVWHNVIFKNPPEDGSIIAGKSDKAFFASSGFHVFYNCSFYTDNV